MPKSPSNHKPSSNHVPRTAASTGPKPARATALAPAPVAIIVSRYNDSITSVLLQGAIDEFARRGGAESDLEVFEAPGAYELPVLSRAAVLTGRFSGAVALGCLIRGETRHDRYIADAVAHGLMEVSVRTGVPVAFGVLTVENPGQARDRAGGKKGNKGAEAMAALLDTLDTLGVIGAVGARGGSGGEAGKARSIDSKPDKARGRGSQRSGRATARAGETA